MRASAFEDRRVFELKMAANDTESEYERARRIKIEENKAMLKKLFPQGTSLAVNFGSTISQRGDTTPKKRQHSRRKTLDFPLRRNPDRKTRSFKCIDEEEENAERVIYTPNTLVVKWRGPLTEKLFDRRKSCLSDSELSDCDSDDSSPKSSKKRRKFLRKPAPRAPVDVREEDLILVAERVADKTYDSVNGTSCHQCRQKTDDLKTTCKSDSCIGIRGQFCGPCLKNRYGEDAKKSIMDPTWMCPPCRGICNCSFCMKKRGRRCTGIMIHLAREKGFGDVKTFLGD